MRSTLATGSPKNIITDLSKFHDLLVVASNSTFAYRDKPISVGQIGRELGVRYVLEGSVQRKNQRVRINAQLIDAASGPHHWAEPYDESIDDIFDLQDKITKRIVQSLAVRMTDIELDRVAAKPTSNLEASQHPVEIGEPEAGVRRCIGRIEIERPAKHIARFEVVRAGQI